jgi:hypothetical protein
MLSVSAGGRAFFYRSHSIPFKRCSAKALFCSKKAVYATLLLE